jgi:hypothetical protein
MMKLILIFSFLLCSLFSIAQYPNGTQFIGTDSNVVQARGGLKARVIPYVYLDTTAANLERIRQYPGAEIYTSLDNKKWFRSSTVDYWIQITSGTSVLFARTDARNNTGSDMYFSSASRNFTIDSVSRLNVNGKLWVSDTAHAFIADALGMSIRIPHTLGTQSTLAYWIQDSSQQQADISMVHPANFNSRFFRIRVGNTVPVGTYSNDGVGFGIAFMTGANSAFTSSIWRNGNWSIGNSTAIQNYRLYKKFGIDGSIVVLDSLMMPNIKTAPADTVNFKLAAWDASGNLYRIPWAYAESGGGGSLTNFSFSDGNGFIGSVTNPTTTPQLQLSTSIGNTYIVTSDGSAFIGANTFIRSPATFYSYQTNDVNLEVESGSDYSGMQITPTKTQFYYNPGTNNTVVTVVDILRNKSGTSANGIGGSLDFSTIDNGNLPIRSNSIQSSLTTVTSGATTSRFSVLGRSAGTEQEILRMEGTGAVKLASDYGTNTFTGTPAYSLAVDATGYIITTTGSSSSGSSPSDTLYVLWTGQSNTSGFNLGNVDTASNSMVQAWNTSTNSWVTMRRGVFPMGTYTPGVSWGTGGFGSQYDTATGSFFYFAKRLQERTKKVIRVFNFSWGASSIINWIPSASTNFSTITSEIAAAGNPHISFMAWMQGESDNSMTDTTYKNKLDTMVQQLDAQTWFGKDVPIFIITVAGGVGGNIQMNHIQKAISSGQYDPRYTFIDGTFEPVESDNIHFTAQGQYNIGNSIIQNIFNRTTLPNNWRNTDSTERSRQMISAPNLNKGTVLRDSSNSNTYFLKPIYMLNGNNTTGIVLGSTNAQTSRLVANTGSDGSADIMAFSLDHMVNQSINGRIQFMTSGSSTGGYLRFQTTTTGVSTTKMTLSNAGDLDLAIGRITTSGTYTSNSAIRAGTFEIQPFAVNNGWFGDNAYYNGGFLRRSTGFAAFWYFATGGVSFAKAPSAAAGTGFTPTYSAVFNNDGTIGLGGSASGVNNIAGTTLQINAASLVINESGADIDTRIEGDNDANLLTIDAGADRIGIGVAGPTSYLHVKAGTATASTSPLKFTAGTNLTNPEAGAVEFDGTNFFGTASSTRYTFAKTLTNTATLDFDLTAVNYQDLTITVTGAAVNDAVSISVDPGALVSDVTYFATVTAANTVTIRCSRVGGGGAANPGSGTFRAAVIKY